MKKLIASALLILLVSVLKAEITGLFTFPSGSNGDVQINEDGYFGGRTLTAGSNVTISTNSSQITISATGGGGGGTPGGSNNQIQYNNSGSFGGASTLNFYPSTNTLTIGATTIFQSVSTTTWQGVESVVIGDGALLDLSAINMDVNTEGLKLPQSTDCSGSDQEGQACWDTDDDILYVGGSNPTGQFPNRDTLTIGSTVYPDFLYVRSSATITGPLITRSPPMLDGEATSKSYVDSVATGLSVRASAMVASTGSLVLSGIQTIDGVLTVQGDRILVKNQANGVFNGIYLASSTSWPRSLDYDESEEVASGSFITITTGTNNRNTQWVQISSAPTINVSTLTFSQLSQQTIYSAGSGLNLTSFVFSIPNGGVSLTSMVSGILPSANLPSTVTYTTTSQTISGSKIFSSSQVFSGLLVAGSTFTVTRSTIVINGSTTYWTIPRPASNKIFQLNSSGQVTLVDDQTGGGSGSTIYNATATAGFPFGSSFSTITARDYIKISTSVSMAAGGLPPWGLYVGPGSITYPPIKFVDSLYTGNSGGDDLGGFYHHSTNGVSIENTGQTVASFSDSNTQGIRLNEQTVISSTLTVIATNTASAALYVGGHIHTSTLPIAGALPTLSSCGTSPSILGTDVSARIVTGTPAIGGSCIVTFGSPWVNKPVCVLDYESTTDTAYATTTTTTLTINARSGILETSKGVSYVCLGWQ